jgi:hypothetical protein
MAKWGLPLILILLLTTILAGCPSQPPASGSQPAVVTVVVTRDFGKELILAQEIELEEGTDAMTALQAVAEVETKYGGGFVEAIEAGGVKYSSDANSHLDWLYYINGMSLNIGAKEYILRDGDAEHWDFRDWRYRPMIPAIIGAFPQPFINGIKGEVKPTAVVYDEPFAQEAGALAEKLEGWSVAEVLLTSAEALSEAVKESYNLIIIGRTDNGPILELNGLPQKLGFFAYVEGGKIITLDGKGDPAGEYGGGYGLVQATQNPWSPGGVGSGESCVFMVTGSDEKGIKKAAQVLINNSEGLRYAYAVLVNNNQIIKIP